MRLLRLEFFRHLTVLLGNDAFYALKYDRLLEWSTAQQVSLTALALALVFASAANEISDPLQFERPDSSPAEVVTLSDARKVVHPESTLY